MQILSLPLKGLKVFGLCSFVQRVPRKMSTSVPIRWRQWPGLDHALAGLNQALRAEHQSQGSVRAGHFGSARRPPGLWSLPGWNNLWSQEPSPEGSSSRDDIQALLWGYIHPHSGESGQEHFASYFFK